MCGTNIHRPDWVNRICGVYDTSARQFQGLRLSQIGSINGLSVEGYDISIKNAISDTSIQDRK